jgi:chaperonin GroES
MATVLEKLISLSKKENIAKDKDEDFLTKLGDDVVSFTKEDDGTREQWLKKSKEAMDHALQVTEDKNTPWPNASNVKYPLLTIAALQFNARAYPAAIQGNQVVGTKTTGSDPEGTKADQGKRVAQFMNWQLLEQQEEWEEQFDKLLIALPIEGCEFKKTFFSPAKGHNASEWIRPLDLIVNDKTKDLATCPRITHRIWKRPRDIVERQRIGTWIDVDLSITSEDDDKETPQEFYEQHTYLDLDGDGYKEPYAVTVHVESEKVVRIKADFFPEDITIKKGDKIVKIEDLVFKEGINIDDIGKTLKGVKVVKIDRFGYFTKYSFIPSPDGSFYDIGFGQLTKGLNDSVDTNINQLNDAGTLDNNQTGFIRDGIEVDNKRGVVKTSMGEFIRVKVPSGTSIRDAILPMSYAGPSATLFNLLGLLIQGVKDITSVQDIFTGGQQQNETATTTLTRVEQGLKVFTAIYKRIYRSLKQEFKTIYRLNALFLEPQTYFNVLDSDEQASVTLSDFRNDGTDVQPVGDPSISTLTEKIAKAQLVREEARFNPIINQEVATRRFLEAIEIPKIDELIIPAEQRQPPPDPEMIRLQVELLEGRANVAKTEEEVEKVKADTILTYAKAVEAIAGAESKEAGDQLAQYRFSLEALVKQMEIRSGQNQLTPVGSGPGDTVGVEQTGQGAIPELTGQPTVGQQGAV